MKNQKSTARLFIGIPLSDAIKNELEEWANKLKHFKEFQHLGHSIRWIHKENFHITFEFLGQIEIKRISVITTSLKKILKEQEAFEVIIGELLFLSSRKRPRVFAIKVTLTETLGKLYALIHQKMLELKINVNERPFLPHITLGRIKTLNIELPENLKFDAQISYQVKKISLFQSKNTESNKIYYQPLETIFFRI